MTLLKTCSTCKETKEVTAFYRSSKNPDEIHQGCRECRKAAQRTPERMEARKRRNKDNEKHIKQTRKNRYYKKTYGISREDYDSMRIEQNHCCYICGMHESDNHNKILYVDHDHDTGQVRKLLCSKCNHGLGLFNDSPLLLEKAAQYLEAHGRTQRPTSP